MKLVLRRWSGFVLILCWLVTSGYGQVGQKIQKIEIRHVGPPAASESLIRANIRVKEGESYVRTSVDDDVRSLYSTGFFYNIRVATEPAQDGISLVYVLQGKPVLTEINFSGNEKYSRRKLLKKVTSKIGEPLDERKLHLDALEMEKMYQKSGYQRTKVTPEARIENEAAGRGTVTFNIEEAPKVKIDDVEFVGAQSFSQRKLRKVVKTRRWWMFSWITGSGVLKDEVFQDDKQKLTDFYQNEGYIDFELKDVKFDYLTPRKMVVRFIVSEGQQYRVGSVDIKGNSIFSKEEIMQGFFSEGRRIAPEMIPGAEQTKGNPKGDIFTPTGLRRDTDAIRDFYGSKGYVDTGVRAIKIPNTERGTMDIVYEVRDEDKGRSFIERIDIQGNTKTKDKVLRRELAVSPGEPFDLVRVRISKSRLEQMRYFDKVETDFEPTDVQNRKDLVINVEEGTTGHVELGAGFSSIDSLFGFVGYREGNFDLFNPPYFRGAGQKLRVGATIGLRRKDFQVSFTEPWFLNRKLALGVDLYHSELNYYSDLYDFTQTGARLSLTKALPFNLIGSVSYTIENIGLEDVSDEAPLIIQAEPENRLVSKIGASLAYDTRNNAVEPTRGQRTEVLSEFAGGPLGAEADFVKWEVRSSWFFPGFFEGHVWEVVGRTGVVEPYGDSEEQTGIPEFAKVPLFDRFFLGGVTSLRGFRYRTVGPHIDDEPVGGNTFYFGSVDYTIPIVERLKFAIFYDIGNVMLDAYDYDFKEYSDNWGVGIRLNIPRLGPLRLDYGIPINYDEENVSGSGKFQFSVGFTRDY
ncbi:MAG TPA: outer membrane protein assembly factor BamA [Candidatus Kapabacteria bacterium]|nr:outer membrane protein assembly factor BamA [Candidatus Kapabacteria bacterium]